MIDERLAAWALSEIKGVGPAGFLRLIEKFGSAASVFERSYDALLSAEIVSPSVIQKITSPKNWDEIGFQVCQDNSRWRQSDKPDGKRISIEAKKHFESPALYIL